MFDILLYAGKYRVIDFAVSVYVCVALTTWNIKYILIDRNGNYSNQKQEELHKSMLLNLKVIIRVWITSDIHMYPFSPKLPSHPAPHNIEHSSMCCILGPCWLSILYIAATIFSSYQQRWPGTITYGHW